MLTFRTLLAGGVFARAAVPFQGAILVLQTHYHRARRFRRGRSSITGALVVCIIAANFTGVVLIVALLSDFLHNGDNLVVTGRSHLLVQILAVLTNDFITVRAPPFDIGLGLTDRTLFNRRRF